MKRSRQRVAGATHAILRIGAGALFFCHGAQKLFGWFGGFGGVEGATAPLLSQLGAAGVLESVGGVLIILGLFTRPIAVVLLAEMIVAYTTQHFPLGGWPIQNNGELALLYALIFLSFVGSGAGPFSIDFLRHRPRNKELEEPRQGLP